MFLKKHLTPENSRQFYFQVALLSYNLQIFALKFYGMQKGKYMETTTATWLMENKEDQDSK